LAQLQGNAPSSGASTPPYFHCPPVVCLTKNQDDLSWFAKGGYKSYQQSFAVHISQFLGAQWSGIRVGQIICAYQGQEKVTFPIAVVFNKLVFEPTTANWSKNMGGYRNCKSNNPTDCPFLVQIAPKPTNIYQEAEQLKKPEPVDSGL
ncbi:MAG TPA: T4SS-associated protein EirA, partial [Coxiellaceae bacterium]|nr:T4SS-associated protein EirA [Coxiellaceae bacterium]